MKIYLKINKSYIIKLIYISKEFKTSENNFIKLNNKELLF